MNMVVGIRVAHLAFPGSRHHTTHSQFGAAPPALQNRSTQPSQPSPSGLGSRLAFGSTALGAWPLGDSPCTAMSRGPEGRMPNVSPVPEGLGLVAAKISSAVGAEPNLGRQNRFAVFDAEPCGFCVGQSFHSSRGGVMRAAPPALQNRSTHPSNPALPGWAHV